MDCAYQNNSDDCGLCTIANAVVEAFGTDPTIQEYEIDLMRGHLIHCLEKNENSPFPARSWKSSFADGVKYFALVKCQKKAIMSFATREIYGITLV